MSLENEDQSLLEKAPDSQKRQLKISFTRELLLSLCELDVCLKLPSDLDQSIISDLYETSQGEQDRQRFSGNLPFQGLRRSEYGSSPPTGGDSRNNSWGTYGRWDSRSSGRSDKDSDSQSDWDSDSGKRYINQSRQSWQSSERDGLLGSGSVPRPSGYAPGMPVPKVQANENYQLNRSNEPYHPPRPYKAVPHSRRETNDSRNDETFGSIEGTNEDRVEEERRRRASFELMRKEQQKSLHEKQKLSVNKLKNGGLSDIMVLPEDANAEKRFSERSNDLDVPLILPVSNNDSGKSSQVSSSRPLVPPGFRSTIQEKNAETKSLIQPQSTEIEKPDIEQNFLQDNINPVQHGTRDNQEERESRHEKWFSEQLPDKSMHAPFLDKGEMIVNSSSDSNVSNKKLGMDNHLFRASSLSEAHEALDNVEIIELNAKRTSSHKIVGDSNHENSPSILDKIFFSAFRTNMGGPSGLVEHHDSKQDDVCSPKTVESSKFGQWFFEEDKKPAVDLSAGRPSDLLSLVVDGEKGVSNVSDVKAAHHTSLKFSYPNSQVSNRLMTPTIPPTTTGISEQLYNCITQEAVPAVLTCEDLEQTILSEYNEKGSIFEPSVQSWNMSGAKSQQPQVNVDDQASQHILSLLQKGPGPNDMAPSSFIDTGYSDNPCVAKVGSIVTAFDKTKETNVDSVHNSGKALTLETLFGTAFMTELKSGEAPVSVQRGSVGSVRTDVQEHHGSSSFPVLDNGLFPSTSNEIGYHGTSHENNVLGLNHRQQIKLDKINNWTGFDHDPQIEFDSSMPHSESKHNGFDGAVEIQLPEEDSLIAVGDSVNPPNVKFMPAGKLSKGDFFDTSKGEFFDRTLKGELVSPNTPVDIVEKLAAMKAVFKDEPSVVGQGLPFVRGTYDLMEPEIPYHNLHDQPAPSAPLLHLQQINRGRPLFHPLDSRPAHINSQMKFMAPESIIHHDAPPNHHFSANMLRPPFQYPNRGLTEFDRSAHHPLLQQMQMTSNFPPPHLLHEFPNGAPLPPHSSNQTIGFLQEPNPVQRFSFGHQQPNVGGLGVPLAANNVSHGTNHPDAAFQRFIEMEVRAKAKQINHLPVGHSQGTYGRHELDMGGFRYR